MHASDEVLHLIYIYIYSYSIYDQIYIYVYICIYLSIYLSLYSFIHYAMLNCVIGLLRSSYLADLSSCSITGSGIRSFDYPRTGFASDCSQGIYTGESSSVLTVITPPPPYPSPWQPPRQMSCAGHSLTPVSSILHKVGSRTLTL